MSALALGFLGAIAALVIWLYWLDKHD
ncbi:hypothetical protein D299_gp206 [Escherichia phage HX01]|nr:hypothetical protein D299_gp206 [Escherichia phage HX01]